MLQGVITGIK
jgi:uncharacterized protein YehS (DUF1456 family)